MIKKILLSGDANRHHWPAHRRTYDDEDCRRTAEDRGDRDRRAGQAMAKESLYHRMGGAVVLHAVVDAFYDIIENDPSAASLHILHLKGHGIAHSRLEQFNYLSGFLGGPRLYVERYGHSDVREMHRHVDVDARQRDLWLSCMSRAIEQVGIVQDVADTLMKHFRSVANLLERENRSDDRRDWRFAPAQIGHAPVERPTHTIACEHADAQTGEREALKRAR